MRTPAGTVKLGLRAAHLVALLVSLGLGLWLCGSDLGWSDSLWQARPGLSPIAYVSRWYRGLNGRLSQAIVAALALIPFSRSATPESFPFWVFAGLSFFCVLMTPLLVGASVVRVTRRTAAGAIVALLLLAVWSTNPVLFENVTYHHFAIFIDYLLPTYVTALWFRHALELAHGRPSRRALVVHGLGYLFLSNYVEVFLLSVPLLGLLAWAVAHRERPRTAGHWARLVSAYGALSAAAAFVYWISPGQRNRAVVAGLTVPAPSDLPLGRLRDLVPVQFFGLSSRQGSVLYGVALLGFAGFLIAWAVRSRARRPGERLRVQDGLVAAAGVLFLAHGVGLLPALVVEVVGRVAIYPSVLLVTSLALVLLAVLQGLTPGGAAVTEPAPGGRDPEARRARRNRSGAGLLLVGAAAVALGVAAAQLRRCASLQAEREELFALRRSIYTYVLGLHRYSGTSAFVLTGCNLAPRGEPIEPPWGLEAYFAWGRRVPLRVFIDTNYDYPERPRELAYAVVSCRPFLEAQARIRKARE